VKTSFETIHILRVGPAPDGDRECAYVGWALGESIVQFAKTDEDGVSAIRDAARGRSVRCDEILSEAAKAAGLRTAKAPRGAHMHASSLGLLVAMGDAAPAPAGRKVLIEAAAVFRQKRPWEHLRELWRPDRQLRIRVDGTLESFTHMVLVTGTRQRSEAPGFYLFTELSHAERMLELMEGGDEDAIGELPGIHVLCRATPPWLLALIERGIGGPAFVPWALRTSARGVEPCSAIDAHVLAATLLALARLAVAGHAASVRLETTLGPIVARIERG